jgi:hypothetical protein
VCIVELQKMITMVNSSSITAPKVSSSADRISTTMDLQEHIQGLNVGDEEEEGTLQFAAALATAPPPPKQQRQPAPRARAPPTRRVDHTYRDYSRLPWDKHPVSGKTGSSKFPAKLHEILSNPEFSHVRYYWSCVA